MKFGQLIGYSKRFFFFFNHAENKAGKLVLDHFFVFFLKRYIR